MLPHARRHKMSIRRQHGSFPPAISADYRAKCAISAEFAAFSAFREHLAGL